MGWRQNKAPRERESRKHNPDNSPAALDSAAAEAIRTHQPEAVIREQIQSRRNLSFLRQMILADDSGNSRRVMAQSEQTKQQIRKRRRQEGAVDDVEDAAEAGDESAGIFDFGVAFHHRFEQIAELSDSADDDSEDHAFPPRDMRQPVPVS